MHKRNIEARSLNRCCRGNAINITYSEGVSVALHPACNANAPYCHLWPVRLYDNFPHYLIKDTILGKKITEYKMCVLIFSKTFLFLNISHSKKNRARYYHTRTEVETRSSRRF